MTLAGFGAERFSAALGTAISFSQLACHVLTSCKRVSLLFEFHGLAAAGDGAVAPLGDNHLGAALGAAISFAYRISHVYHLFLRVYPLLL